MHRRILLLGWILVCGACGTEDPTTPVPVPTTITLSRSSLALSSLGETSQLSATVLDEGGSPITGAVVAWSSSDPSVAEVSGTGAVTAIANGEATVSATFGAASASVAVTVEQVPAAVLISPSLLVLDGQGDTATVAATVEDALGTALSSASVVWSTDDGAIATVTAAGLVTGVLPGATAVNASAGSVEGSASVTVNPIAPEAASYATVGNTELVTGAYPPPTTPHAYAAANVLALTPGTSVTSVGATATAEGGTVDMQADGDFSYLPPPGFGGGSDTFDFTVEGGLSATVTIEVSSQVVWYVDNRSTAGASGSSQSPFATMSAAESASGVGDVVYVHAGDGSSTGYDQGIVLKNDQQLIGEAIPLVVGSFGALAGAGSRPFVTSGIGAGVTLADNNRVGGLAIVDAVGPALAATGVSGGQLDQLRIVASNDAALSFTDATGRWDSSELDIESSSPSGGLVVARGDPELTINVAPSATFVNHPGAGHAIRVDSTSGGFVRIEGGPVLEQGAGVRVVGVAGEVHVTSKLEVVNPSATGLYLLSSSGTMTFSDIDITTVGQEGIETLHNTSTINLSGRVNTTDDEGWNGQSSGLGGGPSGPINATFSSFVVHNDGLDPAGRSRALFIARNPGVIEIDTLDLWIGSGYNNATAFEHLQAGFGGAFRVLNPESRIVAKNGHAFSIVAGPTSTGGENYTVEATLAWLESADRPSAYGNAAIALHGVDGYVDIADGLISEQGRSIFVGNGGTADLTYGGAVTTAVGCATCAVVEVIDKQGGSVSLEGPITSTANGVTLSGNTGGTTVRFSGGLDVQVTTDSAFVANGGGRIEVTGAGNVLSATTDPGLQLVDTEIGPTGVTFQSVSVDGAAVGIEIDNTGALGSLSVTGTGPAGSGGTIQNTSGAGIRAQSTTGLTLADLTLSNTGGHSIEGTTLNGLTLRDVEILNSQLRGLSLSGPSGTVLIQGTTVDGTQGPNQLSLSSGLVDLSIDGSTFTNAVDGTGGSGHGIELVTTGGQLGATLTNTSVTANGRDGLRLDASGGTVSVHLEAGTFSGNGEYGIDLLSAGTADVTASRTGGSASSNSFAGLNAAADGTSTLDLTVDGSSLFDQNAGGITLRTASGGVLTFDIDGNTMSNTTSGGATSMFAEAATGSMSGHLRNNSMDSDGSPVIVRVRNNGVATLSLAGNTIVQNTTWEAASIVVGQDAGDVASLDLTVDSNNVTPGTSQAGIRVQSRHSTAVCANIRNNTFGAGGSFGVWARQDDTSTYWLERLVGTAAPGEESVVTAQLDADNPPLVLPNTTSISTLITGQPDGTCKVPVG